MHTLHQRYAPKSKYLSISQDNVVHLMVEFNLHTFNDCLINSKLYMPKQKRIPTPPHTSIEDPVSKVSEG